MRLDPSEPLERLPRIAALEYFTDREDAIHTFLRHVNAATIDKVLVFYGVGGIGKTTLVQRLAKELRDSKPPLPCALFSMENIGDQTRAYREVLLRWRSDLESQFRISFPHFDLCLGVMLAREGGDPPPVFQRPSLKPWLEFGGALIHLPLAHDVVALPIHVASTLINKMIVERFPQLEDVVRRAGGSGDVLRLRERALRDDQTLPDELIRRFVQDLNESLSARKGKDCRGVLFLDSYEKLWSGREAAASAQARLLDEWVRTLAAYCCGSGVLLVISGRDRLGWADSSPDRKEGLEQHLLGGLSSEDAQTFLARCKIGSPPINQPASPLQRAIIACCNESMSPSAISVHPLYLALCAEIVVNTRKVKRIDPKPDVFTTIPTPRVAEELADAFLRSLHNRALELWIQELSLTPRFDEDAALALDAGRHHQNGRSGWDQLTHFSFVDPQPDGFYRLHKTMRDVLRARTRDAKAQGAIHKWFQQYWTQRVEPSLAWYHRWTLDPDGALKEWKERHESGLKASQIGEARQVLTWWAEVALDENDRSKIGDESWGKTHVALAKALWETPIAPRSASLTAAIEHCQAALRVFTEDASPREWALTQTTLGNAYADLPTGDRAANLRQAIACYEAALRVCTEADFPQNWATTQNNLGNAYQDLPTGDRTANLRQAIACYEAALRVRTKAALPQEWSETIHNLADTYLELPGDREKNLRTAIEHYEAALLVRTETALPCEWAETQHALGLAYQELATVTEDTEYSVKAEEHFAAARRVKQPA